MLLGLVRARPRWDGLTGRGALVMSPSATARGRLALASDWLAERGATRFEATCDVSGGFPGFAQRGGRLTGALLRISDAYLLVDEGQPHGFGLPIQWLDGAAVVPGPAQRAALRVAYRDGATARHFTIALRSGRLPMRPLRTAAHARAALLDLGLPDRDDDYEPALPRIQVGWDQTRGLESENVIWTGPVSAPLYEGGRVAAGHLWLTTRSLIWGSAAGNGLNRVPLSALHDVITGQDEPRQGIPSAYVAYLDPDTGRIDLPFLFDRLAPDRNPRERGAFLVALRSRGVPLGLPAPLIQPWRISVHRVGSLAVWSHPASRSTAAVVDESDLAEESTVDPVADIEDRTALDDVMVAEFAEPDHAVDTAPAASPSRDDYALAADWVDIAPDEAPPATPSPEIAALPALDHVRAYEAAALAVLDEAMQAIRDRRDGGASRPCTVPMPAPALQAAAFTELADLTVSGHLDPNEARTRRARLVAIVEAGVRLRSLVELRDAGHISDAALARKRVEISADLTARLFPSGDR
ncbi:MAG: hypothetical protein ACRDJW_24665 [Thermomicrobiales bacterium]